jgi:TolB-like protein/Flp pilus assembly protein TadD
LGRILEAPQFSSARRLSAFLEFVVRAALRGEEVKESLIAVEVYGRDPSYNPKTDSIVRAEASRLRAKLREYYSETGARDPLVIELPKGAYTPHFRQQAEENETAAVVEAAPRRWGWMAGVVLVAVLAAAAWWLRPHWRPARTIAIVPLQAPAGEGTLEALNDSLTSELIQALLGTPGWKVAGRAPVVDLSGQNQMLEPLRRNVGAEVVLTGSLRVLRKPEVRLTLELVNVSDGYLIWRETYDRTLSTLAESQKQLAQTAVDALTARYTGRPMAKPSRYYSQAREAWSAYTPAGLQQSLWLFQQAIQADAGFAPAWAGFADANIRLADDAADLDTRDKVEAARKAALQAISLDDDNAEAHAVLGRIFLYKDWRFRKAAEELRRAAMLDPMRVSTSTSYSQALSIIGDLTGAQAVIQEARARLPLLPGFMLQEGSVFFLAGKFEKMESIGRELVALEPDNSAGHWLVGLALEQKGDARRAIEEFQNGLKGAPKDDVRILCALSHAYGQVGERERALATMRLFLPKEGQPMSRFTLCYCAALTYTSLNEKDEALRWLERAREMKDSSFPFLAYDSRFRPLRGDARFVRLAAVMQQ